MADTVTIPREKWERMRTLASDVLIDAKAITKLDAGRPLAIDLMRAAEQLMEELNR